jgi:hypothetical protein
MLLKLLEDKNGEVQNLAVRCLGPLVHKIKPPQLDIIVDSLCGNMESKDERTRDVSSIALKTVLGELPGSLHANSINCVKRVLPRLTEGLGIPIWIIEHDILRHFFEKNTSKSDK